MPAPIVAQRRRRGTREDAQIPPFYTIDACGLIDLVDEGPDLLRVVVATLGVVIVPTTVLSEADGLSQVDAEALGIRIVDPTPAQLDEAAREAESISFADRVCLLVAADLGLVCITGDAKLARACRQAGVEHWPTLRPLVEMVRRGAMTETECVARARGIRKRNGRYITTQIFQLFEVEVRTAARRRGRP